MSERYAAVEIIAVKRDRGRLTDDQIDWVIDAYVRGVVADEQMSALLMAILLNGMDGVEISRWTDAMIRSGERLSWSSLKRPTVDKHSTGGVGDKITLPLAPLVAACGAAIPQLSGRGLGHTGGTLDKMEAIKGWRASLSNAEMLEVLQACGAVICGAGSGLAPADKKLYALRDVTATVEAIPLIASSIMSKKIAEGTSALVLDVKTGNGAFMSDPERARELARVMVGLGKAAGVKTRALITAMDQPLGLTVGKRQAMDIWKKMVRAQGGDPDAPLPTAREKHQIIAEQSGTISSMRAINVGIAAWRLGAGRSRQGEQVQSGAGIEIHVKPGARITQGQPLFTLHSDDSSRFERAISALDGAVSFSQDGSVEEHLPLIVDRIS